MLPHERCSLPSYYTHDAPHQPWLLPLEIHPPPAEVSTRASRQRRPEPQTIPLDRVRAVEVGGLEIRWVTPHWRW